MGGGILHRLQHGHDFPALREIYDRHGLPGALVWLQHNSQDLATPTGVPLPIGSGKLADWLVSQGIVSPGKAALAVSLNAVELGSAVLAGVYIARLAALVREELRKHRIRQRCERAKDAYRSGDLDGAIANYREAYAVSDRSPLIALSLGWCYAEMQPPRAEAFLAFREAAQGLALTDQTIGLSGLQLSLRGIAYLLALGQAPQVLSDQQMRLHWKDELERLWRGAVVSFEQTAILQSEPVELGPIDVQWRRRPLSAAANYYLAARASLLVPFLPQGDVLRLAQKSDQLLVRSREEYPEISGKLGDVRSRWAIELRPWDAPLLEAGS
jgi:hypothetical protein